MNFIENDLLRTPEDFYKIIKDDPNNYFVIKEDNEDFYRPLLSKACSLKKDSLISWLLKKGANPNSKDNNDDTALDVCIECNFVYGAKKLIPLTNLINCNYCYYLERCLCLQRFEIIDELLKQKELIDNIKLSVRYLTSCYTEMNSRVVGEYNTYSRRSNKNLEMKYMEVFEKFLSLDCPINGIEGDKHYSLPLHCAARDMHVKLIKYFIDNGARWDLQIFYYGGKVTACDLGGTKKIRRLIKRYPYNDGLNIKG